MKKTLALSTALGLMASPGLADVNLLSWGGAYGNSHLEAYVKPFQAETGKRVSMADADNPATPIKAMVEAGNVSADVASVEYADAVRLCDEGLLEEIDPSILAAAPDGTPAEDDFIEGAITDCFVATDVYSMVQVYDDSKFPDDAKPTSPADFFDSEGFPGKRTMRKGAKFNLEFALMADGVPAKDVYKVLATKDGQNRAFRKLDQLKPHIQWWEAGAQPPQFLASGDVVMSSAYNGRIAAVQDESNLQIVWSGGIYDFDSWAIPKGAKSQELARKFIAFSVEPQQQKAYSENIAYGPANTQAVPLLDEQRLTQMPTAPENIADQVAMDVTFWADYGEQLEQRFNAWAAR